MKALMSSASAFTALARLLRPHAADDLLLLLVGQVDARVPPLVERDRGLHRLHVGRLEGRGGRRDVGDGLRGRDPHVDRVAEIGGGVRVVGVHEPRHDARGAQRLQTLGDQNRHDVGENVRHRGRSSSNGEARPDVA
jgi:hypothetical protein